MTAPTPGQLECVQRLLDWAPDSFECRALTGGLNNRCFELRHDAQRYLLRIRPASDGAALLDAGLELELLHAIAAAGIGPAVRAGDAANGLLISEFLAVAQPWNPGTVSHAGNIERLARLLRRLHAVEFELPAFSLHAILERYFAGLETAGADPELAHWRHELGVLARWYGERFEAATVCHNDLVSDNILDDGRKLWLIDFEYAACAHPILDLANLIAMNALDAPACAALCAAYYGPHPPPFSGDEFARVVRMQQLLAYFWVLWSARVMPGARSWQTYRSAWAEALRLR